MNKIHALTHRFHNPDAAILFVRIALAAAFIHAGWLKVTNIDFVVTMFGQMGIPAFLAYVVSYGEFLGGIAVLVGIFSRYAGVLLAIIMLVATFKAHWANGFGMQNGGYEYTFVLFFLSLAMITFGSGKYSLAKLLKKS